MNCFGVIAEFNPFHDGHAYLIQKAKEMTGCSCCVAAMSGDFTQRGEPAIFDKWERAKTAVEHGVDLVVEIPQVFACSSAPYFAKGGTGVLAALGVCSHLVFGSESGSIDGLITVSDFISVHEEEINNRAAALIKDGVSYPKARETAINELMNLSGYEYDIDSAPGPNDILATEYLRQDLSGMKPIAVKRTGDGHIETATRIRQKIISEDPERFRNEEKRLFGLLSYRILTSDAEELESLASAGGGLGNKLKNEIRYASDLEDLISRVKSKVYTRTRITRLFADILLSIHEYDITVPGYIRVLALNDTGAEAIKTAKKDGVCTLPVISNINKDTGSFNDLQKKMISFDIMAGDVYNIIKDRDLYDHSDFVKSPYKA